jgi:protein O-mannosyl-transferase
MGDTSSAPALPKDLVTVTAQEFAVRIARGLLDQKQSITWFFGAGCSISSGVDAAGTLVERWLSELFAIRSASKGDMKQWVAASFKEFQSTNPALSYADVFEARHPFPADRQREIETVCASGMPGYGYATLAQIMSHPQYGRLCNTVLTTNFDDLIEDALYLYGEQHARPLVVTHEALARYVRTNSPRPTIVKLHGDAHIDPKSLKPEVERLQLDVRQQLLPFLQDNALIVVGYGGNDQSILDFMKNAPARVIASPIYWVSSQSPPQPFLSWLAERRALRVNLSNFDQLMHLLRGALALDLLKDDRWERIRVNYFRGYARVTKEFESLLEATDDAKALKEASKVATGSLPDAWADFVHANNLEGADPDAAEKIYKEGLEASPNNALLNGMYGLFLDEIRGDADKAEHFYKRAADIDPKDSTYLINYAVFLANVRHKPDAAAEFYERAVDCDPTDPECLGNYAMFLEGIGNFNLADIYYKRAIEAAPSDTTYLTNYAIFLSDTVNKPEAAEVYYLRAIDADPADPVLRVNYAVFIDNAFGRSAEAEKLFQGALEMQDDNPVTLANYARFLNDQDDVVNADIFFQRALAVDPKDDSLRSEYANFRRKQLGKHAKKSPKPKKRNR